MIRKPFLPKRHYLRKANTHFDLAHKVYLLSKPKSVIQKNLYPNSLTESKERISGEIMKELHDIILESEDVFWFFDLKNFKYIYISPSVYKLRGVLPEEAIHESFMETIHPDYYFLLENLPARIAHYLSGNTDLKTLYSEVRQTHKTKGYIWVEIMTTLITDENGNVTKLLGISRDINKRKQEESLFKNNQSFLETIFDFTSTAILLIEDNGRVLNSNEGFCKMVGYPKEYIVNKSFFHFIVRSDKSCVEELFDLARQEKRFELQSEIRLVNVNNELVWGLINLSGFQKQNSKEEKTQWVIQIQEISRRKKAEEKANRLNADLKVKNQEMEQLVYVTSHDLRSPLVNIQGFSAEIKLSLKELEEVTQSFSASSAENHEKSLPIMNDIRESFSFIESSVDKMDKLLSGLLHYSRLGKKMSIPKEINMNLLMQNVIQNHEYTIKTKNVAVQCEPLFNCYASENMINQVFSNLLGNALKYLDPNKKGVIRIYSQLNSDADMTIYSVEDNGIGIAPKLHHRVFDLFFRAHPEKAEGEGLGLSAVKKILELNMGSIKLKSNEGEGSKFIIYLPTKEKAAQN